MILFKWSSHFRKIAHIENNYSVTSCSTQHMLSTYFLGHLCSSDPVIVQCYLFWRWILYDDVDGLWFIINCYTCIDRCYWRVFPECAGHLTDCGCRWHQRTTLDSRLSQGVDCYGLSISFMHMWHMIDYSMILYMNHWQCFVHGCRLMNAC